MQGTDLTIEELLRIKRHIHVRDDYFKKLRSAGLRKFHGDEHEGYQENFTAIKSIVPYEHSGIVG